MHEDMTFECWWRERQKLSWRLTLHSGELDRPCPATWGNGFKAHAREAWMARAALSGAEVRYPPLGKTGSGSVSTCGCSMYTMEGQPTQARYCAAHRPTEPQSASNEP
jgi:CO dehydrogenase/acetyl-CoA synthase delta subunit